MIKPPEHQISINIKEQIPDNLTALSSSNSNNLQIKHNTENLLSIREFKVAH